MISHERILGAEVADIFVHAWLLPWNQWQLNLHTDDNLKNKTEAGSDSQKTGGIFDSVKPGLPLCRLGFAVYFFLAA